MGLKDEMEALVSSVNEHKKFKQLACYSMDCLSKVLAPPNARWRENLQMATECGAAKTTVQVLRLHPGNEQVLLGCSDTLGKLAAEPRNAEIIAAEGGVEALLASIEAADDLPASVVGDALNLLENLSAHHKALGYMAKDPALIERLLKLVPQNAEDNGVAAAVIRVLDKIAKTAEGPPVLISVGTVQTLLHLLQKISVSEVTGEEEEELAVQTTKVLLRLQREGLGQASLKLAEGKEVFLNVIDAFPESDRVARLAGKVLSNAAGDSVEELLESVQDRSVMQVRALTMLSSIVTNAATAEEVISKGGMAILTDVVQNTTSPKALEQCALIVERLASNPANAKEIVSSGLMKAVVDALAKQENTAESAAALIGAMLAVGATGDYVSSIVEMDGAKRVVECLQKHGDDAAVGKIAADFLGQASASSAVDTAALIDREALEALVGVMKANPDDMVTQMAVTTALNQIAGSGGDLEGLGKDGIVPIVVHNMEALGGDPEMLVESMRLLSSLAAVPAQRDAIIAAGGLDGAVKALIANPKDESIRAAAQQFVRMVSTPPIISSKIGTLQAVQRRIAAGDKSRVQEIPALAMTIGTLATVKQNVDLLVAQGGFEVMKSTFIEVCSVEKFPQQASVLATLMNAMQELMRNDRENHSHEYDLSILDGALQAMSKYGKSAEVATQALKTIALIASIPANQAACLDKGVLEATSVLIGKHGDNVEVLEAAELVLSTLCPGGAQAAELATRQVVPNIFSALNGLAEEGNKEAIPVVKGFLRLIADSASTPATKNLVASVPGATDVITALMDAYDDEGVQDACINCLESFIREEDVLPIVKKLRLVSEEVVAGSNERKMERIKAITEKLGLFLLCGDFSGVMQEAGGVQVLVNVINGAKVAPPSAERNDLIRAALRALGRAAGAVHVENVENAVGVVPFLMEEIQVNASEDALRAVQNLAADSAVLNAMIKAGVVDNLMPLLSGIASADLALSAVQTVNAIAQTEDGAREVLAKGGLRSVADFTTEAIDNNNTAALRVGLDVLQTLTAKASAQDMAGVDLLSILDETLDHLGKSNSVSAQEFNDIARMMDRMALSPETVDAMMARGVIAKQLAILESNQELMKSPEVVASYAHLLEKVCVMPSATVQLKSYNAHDVMLAAMNAVGSANMEALVAAAAVVETISGDATANVSGMVVALDALLDSLESNPDAAKVSDLTGMLQLTSNVMLMEGAVDAATGKELERVMYRTLALLRGMDLAVDQQEAMSAALDALSRLVTVESAKIDVEQATGVLSHSFVDGASPMVVKAACACVGNIALSTAGVRAIASHGIMSQIQGVALDKSRVGIIGGGGIQRAAEEAIDLIQQQCASHAAILLDSDDAAKTLSKILLGATDHKQLMSTIGAILEHEGGLAALLDTLVELQPQEPVGKEKAISAIVRALLAHRDERSELLPFTKAVQISSIAATTQIEPESLVLYESATADLASCKLLAQDSESMLVLCAGLGSDREEIALSVAQMVAKMVAYNDVAVNGAIVDAKIPSAILESLRGEHSPEFVQNASYGLRAMSETIGVLNMGVSKEGMKIIGDVIRKYPDDAYITDVASACLDFMASAFAGGIESLLESHLADIGTLISAAGGWEEVVADDGRVYYFQSETQATQWEEPEAHAVLVNELDTILQLVDEIQATVADVDLSNKLDVLSLLSTHVNDRTIATRVCRIAEAFSGYPGHAELLADHSSIEAICAVLQQHSTDEDLLLAGIRTLEALCKFQNMRNKLSCLEYISIINNTILGHTGNKVLVYKGLNCLALLAYNNPTNITYMMELNVPFTIKKSAVEHPGEEVVQESAISTASNLLYESDENKLAICQECVDQILLVLENFAAVDDLVVQTLRCMGNLSLVDDCILEMVRRRAVERIVVCMEVNGESVRLLKTAMEVISNFAAMEDDDNDEEATRYISEEGGLSKILDVISEHLREPELLSAGLDALCNLGNDPEAAELLVSLGTMEVALQILETQDHNAEVAGHCIRFISVLSYSRVGVGAIAGNDGIEAILRSLQNHLDDEEFLSDAMLTLGNSFVMEENRLALRNAGGLPILVRVMNLPIVQDSPDIMKWVIKALTRLATDDDSSVEVAEVGMHLFVEIVSKFIDDLDLLSMLFELYGQLAFVKENLKVIVQAGAIKIILKSMEFYDTDSDLMVKAINVLDNVVSADEEYATLVMQKGGKEAVEKVKAANQYDEAVVQAADAAILSMEATARAKERDGTKVNRGALFARLGDVVDLRANAYGKVGEDLQEPTSDPLADHRNMLRAGVLLAEYKSGGFVQRHMFISVDWNAIIVKDTAKKAKSGVRLILRNVRKIEAGLGEGHYRQGLLGGERTTAADPEKSFWISTANDADLFLECRSVQARDDLLAGMQVLIRTFRHFPNWLQL